MNRIMMSTVALAVLFLTCLSCAKWAPPATGPDPFITRPTLEALLFPEIVLLTKGGEPQTGKIIRLDRENAAFLPLPYWTADLKLIPIENIQSIRIPKPGKGLLYDVLSGVGWVTCISAALGAGLSSNRWQASDNLHTIPLVGLVLGVPIGLLSTGNSDDLFDFEKMNSYQKNCIIRKIIGN